MRAQTRGVPSSAWRWRSPGFNPRGRDHGHACLAAGGAAYCWRAHWLESRNLLLLDEPTNHLDIETMRWLEGFLADYAGTVLFVTHDRVFLQTLATRIVELDRGRLTSWPGDYATFLRRKEEFLTIEASQDAKFDKRLAEEEVWLRQGIKARRTRNRDECAPGDARGTRGPAIADGVRPSADQSMGERSGQVVFEAERIGKSFDRAIVESLSTRVMRGDRIGLIRATFRARRPC